MNELQRHLQAQRDSAMRLMQGHNQMLAIALGRSDSNVDHSQSVLSTHVTDQSPILEYDVKNIVKGNVVSLFEYKNDKHLNDKGSANNGTDAGESEYLIFSETDSAALEVWGEKIDGLLVKYGSDDALAIHRKILAGTIFSAIFGLIALSFLKRIILKEKFHYFSIYCFFVGVVVLMLFK